MSLHAPCGAEDTTGEAPRSSVARVGVGDVVALHRTRGMEEGRVAGGPSGSVDVGGDVGDAPHRAELGAGAAGEVADLVGGGAVGRDAHAGAVDVDDRVRP